MVDQHLIWLDLFDNPANMRRPLNAGLWLAHRLRHWANISTALDQRVVLVGRLLITSTRQLGRLGLCRSHLKRMSDEFHLTLRRNTVNWGNFEHFL